MFWLIFSACGAVGYSLYLNAIARLAHLPLGGGLAARPLVNRNTRKEGYLVSYAFEYWGLGYEEPDFGEGDIATFSSFKSALEWINRHGVIGHRTNFMSYIYLIESDKYVYTAYNVLKSTKRSEKFYKDSVSDTMNSDLFSEE